MMPSSPLELISLVFRIRRSNANVVECKAECRMACLAAEVDMEKEILRYDIVVVS